jgi:hypothetical protein
MLLPALGCGFGVGAFSVIGIVTLCLVDHRPPRPLAVVVFVLVAFVSATAWASLFGKLFANDSGQLTSGILVILFLGSLPLVGTAVGLLAARPLNKVR